LRLAVALLPAALCGQTANVTVVTTPVIRDQPNGSVIHDPLILGFNVEWQAVQGPPADSSCLWDGDTNQIRPDLINFLKNDFSGAFYRYPGGTPSNYFEWEKTVGTSRTPIKNPNDGQFYIAKFGFNEAVAFAKAVGGAVLPVFNLYSMNGAAVTSATWPALRLKQLAWWEYCNAPKENIEDNDWNGDGQCQGYLRAQHGHPVPYNITTWELGNELDGKISYVDYIARSNDLITAMQLVEPNLDFIAHIRTSVGESSSNVPHPLIAPTPPLSGGRTTANSRDWHNAVLAGLGKDLWALAVHPYYYDTALPWIFTWTSNTWADSLAWAATQPAGTTAPAVVITEHARWPNINDQTTWPMTTSMKSAVSVTDHLLLLNNTNYVQLALNHDLGAIVPWSLFSQVDPTTGKYLRNNTFAPRPLAYALKLVNRALKGADILTASASPLDASGAGYDVRVSGYRYGSSGVQGALMVNKANVNYPLNLTLPGWAAGPQVVRIDAIGGHEATQLWRRYVSTNVASGVGALKLPSLSVFNAVALGSNVALNADFETGTAGNTPPNWEKRTGPGVTGNTVLVADPAGSVNGANVVRLQRTAGTTALQLAQPYWLNSAFGNTGLIANNMNDTFILRANVRTSNVDAGTVKLAMQLFSSGGTFAPASLFAPIDTGGKWVTLETEFVPTVVLAGGALTKAEIILQSNSSNGYAEFDGVTLLRRKNTAVNPNLLDTSPVDGAADGWERRGTGSIVYHGGGTPKFVRLSKGVAAATNQFCQNHGLTSTLAGRLNEKWRLRARVRYTNLASSGAQLKVQFFAKMHPDSPPPAPYLNSSPVSQEFSGTSPAGGSGWVETVLEFNPRELIGSAIFERAEIMVQNNSIAGSIDVSFVSLEPVD
jgi:hypothetical protein